MRRSAAQPRPRTAHHQVPHQEPADLASHARQTDWQRQTKVWRKVTRPSTGIAAYSQARRKERQGEAARAPPEGGTKMITRQETLGLLVSAFLVVVMLGIVWVTS